MKRNESYHGGAAEAEGKEKAEAFRRLRASFLARISGQATYVKAQEIGDIMFKIIS